MTKRQLSRHQREQRRLTVVLATVGALAVIVVGILGYGIWREFVAIGDEPVASVGGKSIPTRTVAKLIGYYDSLYGQQIAELQRFVAENQQAEDETKKLEVQAAGYLVEQARSAASSSDNQAVDQLVEGELLRREQEARGLELSQAALDRALVSITDPGITRLASQLADSELFQAPSLPEPTPEQVTAARERIKTILEDGRILSEADFNQLVLEPTALQQKIQAELAAQVPTKAEQVKASHILFKSEAVANENLALLKAGNLDFAEAAKQLSEDPGSKDKGGDLGWFPRGVMDSAFEEVAFSLEPGQMSDVVASSFGFHIIKVEEKAQEREIAPDILAYQRSAAYSKWLSEQRTKEGNEVVYDYTPAKANWARENAVKPNLSQAKG